VRPEDAHYPGTDLCELWFRLVKEAQKLQLAEAKEEEHNDAVSITWIA